MISATLTRTESSDYGTFGRIVLPSGKILATVELPWKDNQRRVSCIPEGTYVCKPRRYYKGGYDAVEITDVPGRDDILFHVANWPRDVLGCIGVGLRLGYLDGKRAVVSSYTAFLQHFMPEMGGVTWSLTIERDA